MSDDDTTPENDVVRVPVTRMTEGHSARRHREALERAAERERYSGRIRPARPFVLPSGRWVAVSELGHRMEVPAGFSRSGYRILSIEEADADVVAGAERLLAEPEDEDEFADDDLEALIANTRGMLAEIERRVRHGITDETDETLRGLLVPLLERWEELQGND